MGTARHARVGLLSVAVVATVWLLSAGRAVLYQDAMREAAGSVSSLALYAGVRGVIVILIIIGLLRLAGERFTDLGLDWSDLPKQLMIGLGFGVGLFLIDQIVVGPGIDAFIPRARDTGVDMAALFSDWADYPLWVLLAVLKGGFVEELWRICGMTRFERCWGRTGLIVAIVLSSIIFGISHLYQGLGGAVATGIQGLLYALVYLRKKRALEAITAHAVFDLIGITLGFVIYS